MRYDPPTRNTRRFVAHDGTIAGEDLRAGDAILLLLAVATRDPAVEPEADRFVLDRAPLVKGVTDFGTGVHACPADRIAPRIAEIAVGHLLDAGIDLERHARRVSYRRSVNVRIPLF